MPRPIPNTHMARGRLQTIPGTGAQHTPERQYLRPNMQNLYPMEPKMRNGFRTLRTRRVHHNL